MPDEIWYGSCYLVAMDYSDITLFKMMKLKMAYHSERQDMLARNISNIDTPGYKPRDLKPLDFGRMAEEATHRLEVRATNPKHILPATSHAHQFKNDSIRELYEVTPVKNGSSIEQQSMMVAENQLEYQKVTNLYSKISGMFKTSIGKPN